MSASVTSSSVVRKDANGQEGRHVPTGEFVLEEGDDLIVVGAAEHLTLWRERSG